MQVEGLPFEWPGLVGQSSTRSRRRSWGNKKRTHSGAHYPERPSPILSLRDNLCPDWAIFRIVSRERPSPLWSAYGRNQRGKGKKWSRKTDRGCRTSLRALAAIFSELNSVIHGPQWRQKSGYKLDHEYSVDGRSGWWAPDHCIKSRCVCVIWSDSLTLLICG